VRDLHDAAVPLLLGSGAGGTVAHGGLPAAAAEVVRAGVPGAGVVAGCTGGAPRYRAGPGLGEGANRRLGRRAAVPSAGAGAGPVRSGRGVAPRPAVWWWPPAASGSLTRSPRRPGPSLRATASPSAADGSPPHGRAVASTPETGSVHHRGRQDPSQASGQDP